MYQVIGILRRKQQRLLATPTTAREALQAYSENIKDYSSIVIHSPSGETIDLGELRRLANEETGKLK
jgi:hypothetical protein